MDSLVEFLSAVPALTVLSNEQPPTGCWWIKLTIDLDDELAWRVVQELAFVLNGVSVEEPLATVFKPVSPPPYLNGGPREFLSWVIEATDPQMDAGLVGRWLRSRLPDPVAERRRWEID